MVNLHSEVFNVCSQVCQTPDAYQMPLSIPEWFIHWTFIEYFDMPHTGVGAEMQRWLQSSTLKGFIVQWRQTCSTDTCNTGSILIMSIYWIHCTYQVLVRIIIQVYTGWAFLIHSVPKSEMVQNLKSFEYLQKVSDFGAFKYSNLVGWGGFLQWTSSKFCV